MTGERYKAGDNWIIDDITGQKIRASDAVRQWDGLITHRRNHAPRHPQDFVRAKADRQKADIVRPRPVDEIVGPLVVSVTAAADPGDISLTLSSTTGMTVGDRIYFALSNGDTFRTTIVTLYAIGFILTESGERILLEDGSGFLLWEDPTDTLTIGLADTLPYGVKVDALVYDNTAMTPTRLE